VGKSNDALYTWLYDVLFNYLLCAWLNSEVEVKTKEIEVWVDQEILVNVAPGYCYTLAATQKETDAYKLTMIKARLTIEIPEQKIEITESQAEAVWNKHRYTSHVDDFKKALGFISGDE